MRRLWKDPKHSGEHAELPGIVLRYLIRHRLWQTTNRESRRESWPARVGEDERNDLPKQEKTESDAFTNPKLKTSLEARKIDRVVIAGMQSNYCVSATCRGALRQGLSVILASGAHSTYDEEDSARDIEARVESDLEREGVSICAGR